MIKSLFVENETLKNKVAILAIEVENDKECVATLEKSLQVEKDFCKLKDKQIGDLELKLQKAGAVAVFDLLRKWMVKHHPNLDLFDLVIGDVKKEFLSDCPFEATAESVMEEATTIVELIEVATPITHANPIPDKH
nr:hypothetical protein CFP56_43283 [Quercus suber]